MFTTKLLVAVGIATSLLVGAASDASANPWRARAFVRPAAVVVAPAYRPVMVAPAYVPPPRVVVAPAYVPPPRVVVVSAPVYPVRHPVRHPHWHRHNGGCW